jgi:hypothetical protein
MGKTKNSLKLFLIHIFLKSIELTKKMFILYLINYRAFQKISLKVIDQRASLTKKKLIQRYILC